MCETVTFVSVRVREDGGFPGPETGMASARDGRAELLWKPGIHK